MVRKHVIVRIFIGEEGCHIAVLNYFWEFIVCDREVWVIRCWVYESKLVVNWLGNTELLSSFENKKLY